jgi:hypothetical protein
MHVSAYQAADLFCWSGTVAWAALWLFGRLPRFRAIILAWAAAWAVVAVPQWREALSGFTHSVTDLTVLSVAAFVLGIAFYLEVMRRPEPRQGGSVLSKIPFLGKKIKGGGDGGFLGLKTAPGNHHHDIRTSFTAAGFGTIVALIWMSLKTLLSDAPKIAGGGLRAISKAGGDINSGHAASAMSTGKREHVLLYAALGGLVLLIAKIKIRKHQNGGGGGGKKGRKGGQQGVGGGGNGPRAIGM